MMKKLDLTPSRNMNYRAGTVIAGDRYVGVRSEKQLELANHLLTADKMIPDDESPASKLERESKLRSMKVDNENDEDKVCAFRKGNAPRPARVPGQNQNVLYSCMRSTTSVKRSRRYVAKSPERILDAPGIRDDFYTSLSDWSTQNIVSVALEQTIYVWDANKGDADVLATVESEAFPTFLKWSQEGCFLSVGLSDGSVKIYDATKGKCVRTIKIQGNTIGCGCWRKQGTLTYGTWGGRIYHHDVRVQQSFIGCFENHTQKVCGLKWSANEQYLTSGGADSLVNVWESTQIATTDAKPLWTFTEHCATVKAIEYVPFLGLGGSNMVATGGGTNDHTVRIWNLATGLLHSSHDTFSQVSGILFNKTYREMITGHGNPQPGVRLWRYELSGVDKQPHFDHVADLKGHGGRVLGLCSDPQSAHVMSLGADETMRVWDCWKVDASVKECDGAVDRVVKQSLFVNHQNIR